jgi:hypothetical protein
MRYLFLLFLALSTSTAHAQYNPQTQHLIDQCLKGPGLGWCNQAARSVSDPALRAKLIERETVTEADLQMKNTVFFYVLVTGLVGVIAYFMYRSLAKDYVAMRKRQTAPEDGPMRVNLSVTDAPKGSWSDQGIQFGTHWKRLNIDVAMSKQDRAALKTSGFEMHSLFRHRHPKMPDVEVDYLNIHLFNTPYVDFPNLQELDTAKAKLLDGLHALRTRLDQHREFEREQKRPRGNAETFEI